MERDLRWKAESRATALQQKVDEDIEVVRSLRAELGDAVNQRLSAKNVSVKLEKRLPMHEGPFRLIVMSTIFCKLKVMSEGFPSTYEDEELEEMEEMVAPLTKNLADNLKEMVLPPRE